MEFRSVDAFVSPAYLPTLGVTLKANKNSSAGAALLLGVRTRSQVHKPGAQGFSDEERLLEDIRRMKEKKRSAGARDEQDGEENEKVDQGLASALKNALWTAFGVNFAAVLFFLAWLAVALALRLGMREDSLFDAWYRIWPTVIQPSLGILMLGTVISGTLSNLNRREN
uniref:Transmembrane protein n=1 Tax=Compsopogon caeruleus TaxID=31354 RepID=A0A7S1TBK9_9RHOD|mmetsp:Transcript_1517/g.2962  ORF Transcript_1517/g.2962 Transcript_1517/m.2962 type:complete len:169 (+) Transcript_1517:94-600(+)|eukprot:CAMPEP_0184685504 /NCGR_PEP_ID=MMETSP0312-20130426/19243_1 /TAXON_ID=31354 /ORGANISM="Compsopogon coeruleus, Strain SAG 36.94" /LENGTH=168 /DNA_ID=CAMNT_0027139675 /DNA_START=58 /DNA_END=564 /DNA_ORIENTATION=+